MSSVVRYPSFPGKSSIQQNNPSPLLTPSAPPLTPSAPPLTPFAPPLTPSAPPLTPSAPPLTPPPPPPPVTKLGQGTYGCAYYPEFPCPGYTCQNCISKTFKKHDAAIQEILLNREISKVDPTGKYHFKELAHCEIDSLFIPNPECRGINKNKSTTTNIIYEQGYNTLYQDISQSTTYEQYTELFNNMVNLFEGLKLFSRKELYHLDVKGDNILADKTGQYKFIDFGLSLKYPGETYLNSVFQSVYEPWPPYLILLSKPNVTNDEISYHVDSFISKYSNMRFFRTIASNANGNVKDYITSKIIDIRDQGIDVKKILFGVAL
jgi:serine/threonine protein kinase